MAYEFYDTLGVSRDASADDIKKAYRKKAMESHPDRHGGDKAKEAEFKRINEAYATLSDAQKKAHYDRFGSAEQAGGFPGGGGFSGGNMDFGDIFETFFGGGFSGGGGRRQEVGADIEIHVKLGFEEAIRGTKKEIKFQKKVICHDCKGTGAKAGSQMETCADCNGAGRVRRRAQSLFGVIDQVVTCERCGGSGKTIKESCPTCKGRKYIDETKTRTIEIPAGIDDGMTIKLRDEGNEGRDGSGDLFVHFDVPTEFEGLVRDEETLHYKASFDPVEFILGTKKTINIPVIGEKTIDLKPGTDPGSELVFRGEGVSRVSRNGKGDLIVELVMAMPKKLTKKERELYEAIAKEKDISTYNSKGIFAGLFE